MKPGSHQSENIYKVKLKGQQVMGKINVALAEKDVQTDLGVLTSSKLRFRAHISQKQCSAKANKI